MTRVALAFWGLTRSLKFTIDSIRKNVLQSLTDQGVEYVTFMHTYVLHTPYNNPRTHERAIRLNPEEYKLLDPDHVLIEDQDEVRAKLDMEAYRSKGDPWRNNYASLNNFILSLHSRRKVTELVEANDHGTFDYVIFLRPDVRYLVPFDIQFFDVVADDIIAIPNFHMFCGFNDRFAICNSVTYPIYGKLFDRLMAFSEKACPHSETVHAKIFQSLKIRPHPINFFFNRVRATGATSEDCPPSYIARFLQKSG